MIMNFSPFKIKIYFKRNLFPKLTIGFQLLKFFLKNGFYLIPKSLNKDSRLSFETQNIIIYNFKIKSIILSYYDLIQ